MKAFVFTIVGIAVAISLISLAAEDAHNRSVAWKAANCDVHHVACQKTWVK